MPIFAAKSRPCECSFRYVLFRAVAKGEPAGPKAEVGTVLSKSTTVPVLFLKSTAVPIPVLGTGPF